MSQFSLCTRANVLYNVRMATTVDRKKKRKSEDQILDEATMRFLGVIKKHEKAQGKAVTSDQMRKEGYSERFIAKMERA